MSPAGRRARSSGRQGAGAGRAAGVRNGRRRSGTPPEAGGRERAQGGRKPGRRRAGRAGPDRARPVRVAEGSAESRSRVAGPCVSCWPPGTAGSGRCWWPTARTSRTLLDEIEALAARRRARVDHVSARRLDAVARTDAPQGVVALADPVTERALEDLCRPSGRGRVPFLLVLDGVTDPHNLGAVLRSAECAGVTGVVLPRHRAAHLTPTVMKAAAGAVEYLPISVVPGVPSALRRLTALGVWTVGLVGEARRSLYASALREEPLALVLGSEGGGLSALARKRCDELVAIPHYGALPALNVSTAAAVACFDVARRRSSAHKDGSDRKKEAMTMAGNSQTAVDAAEADVIVLGMGPGGEDVAGRLAEEGLDVVGIDGGLVGGECPYWGCIPSKMMIRAADLLAEARRTPELAGPTTVDPDWDLVARASATRPPIPGTTPWPCSASRARAAASSVAGAGWRAATVCQSATGCSRPGGPWSSTPAPSPSSRPSTASRAPRTGRIVRPIEAEEVPPRLAVLGGGAIGAELAQVFSRFGARVTVLEAGPRLIGPEEPEAGSLLAEVFSDEGIDVRTGVSVRSVAHDRSRVSPSAWATAARSWPSDCSWPPAADLIWPPSTWPRSGSTKMPGRCPSTTTCGSAASPGLWAVGDVTGHGQFTHISMYQADIVTNDILGRPVVACRLSSPAPGHLHRPGDRLGRPQRARRPGAAVSTCAPDRPTSRRRPGASSTRRGTAVS